MPVGHREWIASLRDSHDHLVSVVESLSPEQLRGASYCGDWTVAQVLSHIGSSGEIGLASLSAVVAGDPPPPRESYQEIWARWNALSPEEMAAQGLASDEAYLEKFESLDDPTLDSLRIPSFGGDVDVSGAVANRLGEHVLHTWDVEVSNNPQAVLQSGPTEILSERFAERIPRMARGEKPAAAPTKLDVTTSEPTRRFAITIGEEVLSAEPGSGAATLVIPAEAMMRLSFGRLDPAHTPPGTAVEGPISLDELRALFPGY